MYPDFIKQAKAEKNAGALEVFTEAKTAEAGHAQFYAQALNNLETWKVARPFFVCTVCGYTVEKITFEKCPSCLNPKTKYVEVK
jgi:rubrerythrin